MCVIAYGQKKHFKDAEFAECLRTNPSGTYLAVITNPGTAQVSISETRTLEHKVATDAFNAAQPEDFILLHARIPSRGKPTIDNVHGWKSDDGVRFCHNGTMSSIPVWDDHTDSETFFRRLFIPEFRAANRTFDDDVEFLIKFAAGSNNKFAFLLPDGTVRLYGDYVEDHDVKFSNRSYKVYEVPTYPAYRRSAAWDAYDYPGFDDYDCGDDDLFTRTGKGGIYVPKTTYTPKANHAPAAKADPAPAAKAEPKADPAPAAKAEPKADPAPAATADTKPKLVARVEGWSPTSSEAIVVNLLGVRDTLGLVVTAHAVSAFVRYVTGEVESANKRGELRDEVVDALENTVIASIIPSSSSSTDELLEETGTIIDGFAEAVVERKETMDEASEQLIADCARLVKDVLPSQRYCGYSGLTFQCRVEELLGDVYAAARLLGISVTWDSLSASGGHTLQIVASRPPAKCRLFTAKSRLVPMFQLFMPNASLTYGSNGSKYRAACAKALARIYGMFPEEGGK